MQKRRKTIPPIDSFSDLIYKYAHGCLRRLPVPKPCELDDLISDGRVVYYEAAKRFDPARGIKFITLFYLMLYQQHAGTVRRAYRAARLQYVDEETLVTLRRQRRATDTRRVRDVFYLNLSRRAFIFARQLVSPSKRFTAWEAANYKTRSHSPRLIRQRVKKYMGLSTFQERRIVVELQLKLSRGAA